MADKRRTKTETQAGDLDYRLYRVIFEAERLRRQSHTGNKWHDVVQALRAARLPIRALMHPADREETI